MRVFTNEEKELLRRINNRQGLNLYNLIDPWIQGVSFQVNTVTNNVIFIFDVNILAGQSVSLPERLEQIQIIVIQAVNLIKLFEDKGYIFSYRNSNQIPNPFTFGQAAINSPSIPYNFPDIRLSELISKYSTQEIFVTPELGKFIEDKFKTREELRANRQFWTTLTALIVAIIGLLINIGFNIYNLKKQVKENIVNEIQYNYPSEMRVENNNFDSCRVKVNNPIKQDTLKEKKEEKKKGNKANE